MPEVFTKVLPALLGSASTVLESKARHFKLNNIVGEGLQEAVNDSRWCAVATTSIHISLSKKTVARSSQTWLPCSSQSGIFIIWVNHVDWKRSLISRSVKDLATTEWTKCGAGVTTKLQETCRVG